MSQPRQPKRRASLRLNPVVRVEAGSQAKAVASDMQTLLGTNDGSVRWDTRNKQWEKVYETQEGTTVTRLLGKLGLRKSGAVTVHTTNPAQTVAVMAYDEALRRTQGRSPHTSLVFGGGYIPPQHDIFNAKSRSPAVWRDPVEEAMEAVRNGEVQLRPQGPDLRNLVGLEATGARDLAAQARQAEARIAAHERATRAAARVRLPHLGFAWASAGATSRGPVPSLMDDGKTPSRLAEKMRFAATTLGQPVVADMFAISEAGVRPALAVLDRTQHAELAPIQVAQDVLQTLHGFAQPPH